MTDPEGDMVLVHKAELDELRAKTSVFGDQLLRITEKPIHFEIKQEKDHRYWVILIWLGLLLGIGVLGMMQWNTVLRTVDEAKAANTEMCENVWKLLDEGLNP